MVDMLQTAFTRISYCIRIAVFLSKFHRSSFLRLQWIMSFHVLNAAYPKIVKYIWISYQILYTAQMFVTCQNFQIWQGCSFVGLCVCLSVCLFVCYRRDTGRIVWAINTKLGTNMEPVCGMSCILSGVDDVTDDVIRSKSWSNFEIVITSLIFELEHRSKVQNVGHALGFFDNVFNFRWPFRRKRSPQPYNFVILIFFEILIAASIWHQVLKDRPKLCKKKYFHGDDVIDDVTGRPQNRPSIFPYKWKMNFFS